jgi:hypothetical protein
MTAIAPAESIQVALAPKPVLQRLDNLALPVPVVFDMAPGYTFSPRRAGHHVLGPGPSRASFREVPRVAGTLTRDWTPGRLQ